MSDTSEQFGLRHLLLTRFNNVLNEEYTRALDDQWLEQRWALFTTFTLPSLLGQTNADFDWWILCHEETPSWIRKRAAAIDLPSRAAFIYGAPQADLLAPFRDPPLEVLLTTRIDSDDAFHREAIARIRAAFESAPVTTRVLNFEIGYKLDWATGQLALSEFHSPPFSTLIKRQPIGDPLDTGGNHYDLRRNYPYVSIDNGDPMFVQVIHGENLANRFKAGTSTGFTSRRLSARILAEAFNIRDHPRAAGKSKPTDADRVLRVLTEQARVVADAFPSPQMAPEQRAGRIAATRHELQVLIEQAHSIADMIPNGDANPDPWEPTANASSQPGRRWWARLSHLLRGRQTRG